MRRRAPRALALALTAAACAPAPAPVDPPLRPLLYTESTPGAPLDLPQYAEWLPGHGDPTAYPSAFSTRAATPPEAPVTGPALTPDALVLDVFVALAAGDRERLLARVLDPAQLTEIVGLGAEAAAADASALRDGTLATLAVFHEEPPDAAQSVLQAGQLVIGSPRRTDGRAAEGDDVVSMHWGSTLSFTVRGAPGVVFELRFRNIVVDGEGRWFLRAPPAVSSSFVIFRAAGFDLTPALMDTDHAGVPLRVGNYWHYATSRPGQEPTASASPREGYRDAVTDVTDYGRYRVASIRRVYDDPSVNADRLGLLVTPRRLYTCPAECVRRAPELAWVLSYVERQTPLLVFPVVRGAGWGAGGLSRRENAVRVGLDAAEVAVAAGTFGSAVEVSRSTPQGRLTSYFVHGVGFVTIRTDATLQTRVDELVSFRIQP